MILSVLNNVARIKGYDDNVFEVNLADKRIMVPCRDGSGNKMPSIFDFGELLLNGKISSLATADEATSAMFRIRRTWNDSPEKSRALDILSKFLTGKRQERRDDIVIKLVELYGADRARKLSIGVRTHKFWFPIFYMREEGVANCVKYLLDDCTGVASTCQWTPSSKKSAIEVVSMYCSSSKKSVGFRQLLEKSGLAENRIKPVFDIARYLELTR